MMPRRQAGFSLLELLIVALILTVVLFAIYSMYVTNMTTATWGNKKADLQQNARVALDMMQREIRMAGYNPSPSCTGACANAIQDASLNATGLTFIADIDGDNVTDKVQYTFDSGSQTITRSFWNWNGTGWTSVTTNEVVGDAISCPTPCSVPNGFTYKDGSDAVATAPASVRKITIAITSSGQAGSKTQTFAFTSDVRLRNCINPPTCN